jgi:hypothetical protein
MALVTARPDDGRFTSRHDGPGSRCLRTPSADSAHFPRPGECHSASHPLEAGTSACPDTTPRHLNLTHKRFPKALHVNRRPALAGQDRNAVPEEERSIRAQMARLAGVAIRSSESVLLT